MRHQLFTPVPSRSAQDENGDRRRAFGFRRHGATRRTGGGGGGGGESGGGPGVQREQAPPGELPIEQRRLVRMVATLALDQLQQLDPLGLFKTTAPAPPPAAAAAAAIRGFTTIRRRSQSQSQSGGGGGYGSIRDLALDVQRLLRSNATAFNCTGPDRHKEAT